MRKKKFNSTKLKNLFSTVLPVVKTHDFLKEKKKTPTTREKGREGRNQTLAAADNSLSCSCHRRQHKP